MVASPSHVVGRRDAVAGGRRCAAWRPTLRRGVTV